MFLAKTAKFTDFKPVGIVLLILDRIIVTLLTIHASQCDLNSHKGTSQNYVITVNNNTKIKPPQGVRYNIS